MTNPTLLIAQREISTRIRAKSVLISTLATVLIFVAFAYVPKLFEMFSAGDESTTVAVVGQDIAAAIDSASLDGVDVEPEETAQSARAAVAYGDAAIAVAVDGTTPVIYYSSDTDQTILSEVTTALTNIAQAQALAHQGVDMAQLQEDVAAASPSLEQVATDAPEVNMMTAIIAFVIGILMFMQLLGYGVTVAQGVVEEKQSRVVEILLSTVTPRQLLIGKVLGIGVVGFIQLAIFLAVAGVAATQSGFIQLDATTASTIALTVAWFIPSYLFYAFAYAGAASLVSRQEDIGQTTNVLTYLITGSYLAAVFAMQDMAAPWVAIVSIIPPFSTVLLPMAASAGVVSIPAVLLATILLLAATVGMSLLGARLYRNSVLRTGARVTLRDALSRAS